ncbi:MAG: glycosyltransferase family 2 protein [Janthinobacterium lividum]
MRVETVTLCAIAKDEGPYLLEWIGYHKLIGFDRIVIFSNDSSDGSDRMLDTLARQGVVEHWTWPSVEGVSPQLSAYAHAVQNCVTRWICFIDIDEFLVLKHHRTLAEFLGGFDRSVSAVALNWRLFGSSGRQAAGDGLVIERFTRAAPFQYPGNRHCKTIARAEDIAQAHIHRCFLKRGRYVGSTGEEITIERMGFTSAIEHEAAQINHYVVKSYEEFKDKQRRGNANRPPGTADKFTGRSGKYFDDHDRNEETDSSLQRFVEPVEESIQRLQRMVDPPVLVASR